MNVKQLIESEGFKILNYIDSLKTSEFILNNNLSSLITLIDQYEKDEEVWHIANRQRLHTFQLEFARLFHNYLCSAKSLLDHTRRVKKKLDRGGLGNRYDLKRSEILNGGHIYFIQDLREYAQHYSILPISVQSGTNSEDQTITLQKVDLLEFDGWNAKSKKFIAVAPKKFIRIKETILDYQKDIGIFYKWFYKEIEAQYSSELKIYWKEYKKISRFTEKFLKSIKAI